MTTVKWLTHKDSPTITTNSGEKLRLALEMIKCRVKPRTYSSIKSALERLGEAAVRLNLAPIHTYTDEEIARLSGEMSRGLCPSSANIMIGVCARLIDTRFKWVMPKRTLKSTRRPLTEDEIYRLLHHCKPYWKVPIMVGLLSGLRIGDTAGLKWCNVTDESITIRQQKTGSIIRVPLHPDLKDEFAKMERPIDGNALVFPALAEKSSKSIFYKFQMHAAIPAGMENITFHYLRHTFVSRLHESGCPLPAALALAGHCSTLIHLTYAQPSAEGLLDAIKHLPGINHELIKETLSK